MKMNGVNFLADELDIQTLTFCYPSKDHSSSVIVSNIGLTGMNDFVNCEGAGRREKH